MKKLSLKDAQTIMRREVGTAAGLQKGLEPWGRFELVTAGIRAVVKYNPETGKVELRVRLLNGDCCSVAVFDRKTLEPDYKALGDLLKEEKAEQKREWVGQYGPEVCCREVRDIWLKM